MSLAAQVVIDVGSAAAPGSPHDAFLLSAARAGAGVIVTTGANVRAERRLTHELFGVGAAELQAWRTAQRGDGADLPPCSVVLSRDPSLDLSHPLFSQPEAEAATTTILTDCRAAALALRRQCETEDRHAHVIELQGRALALPISQSLVAYARGVLFARQQQLPPAGRPRRRRGGEEETVLLECGIRTMRGFYEHQAVDELLLSVYRSSETAVEPLAREAQGAAFLSWDALGDYFGEAELARGIEQQYDVRESEKGAGGSWSFLRFRHDRKALAPTTAARNGDICGI